MAGLVGEGGKRWLQCSLCDHEWRFNRHTCPRCNDSNHENQEYFFNKDSPLGAGERVDLCNNCNSYLLTVDLRQKIDPVNMEIAAMGMIPLDILAQAKGYTPTAATPWNSLS
jgi:FdhE protein